MDINIGRVKLFSQQALIALHMIGPLCDFGINYVRCFVRCTYMKLQTFTFYVYAGSSCQGCFTNLICVKYFVKEAAIYCLFDPILL